MKLPTLDIESLFDIGEDSEFLGFLGFTYSFDSEYFILNIGRLLHIRNIDDIKRAEFFYIVTNNLTYMSTVFTLTGKVRVYNNPYYGDIFHPKLYIIKYRIKNKIKYRIIVGSFNLNKKSLNNNLGEIGFYYEAEESNSKKVFDKELNKFINFVLKNVKINKKDLVRVTLEGFEFISQYDKSSIFDRIKESLGKASKIHIISPYWNLKDLLSKIANKKKIKEVILYNCKEKIDNIEGVQISYKYYKNHIVDYEDDLIEARLSDKELKELKEKLVLKIDKKYYWRVNSREQLKRVLNRLKIKNEIQEIIIRNYEDDIERYLENNKTFIHAKIIIIEDIKKAESKIFIGSFNATKKGLGIKSDKKNRKNIECGVLLKTKKKLSSIIGNIWEDDNVSNEGNEQNNVTSTVNYNYAIDYFLNNIKIKCNDKERENKLKITIRINRKAHKAYEELRKNNLTKLSIEAGGTPAGDTQEILKNGKKSFDIEYEDAFNGLNFYFFFEENKKLIKRVLPILLGEDLVAKLEAQIKGINEFEDTFKESTINENIYEITKEDKNVSSNNSDTAGNKREDKLKRFPYQSFIKYLYESDDYYLKFYYYLQKHSTDEVIKEFEEEYGINIKGLKAILDYYLSVINKTKRKKTKEIKKCLREKYLNNIK